MLASLLSHAWIPIGTKRPRKAKRHYKVRKPGLTIRQVETLYRAARREIPQAEQKGLVEQKGFAYLPPLKEIDLPKLRDDLPALERIATAINRAIADRSKRRLRREEEQIILLLIQ